LYVIASYDTIPIMADIKYEIIGSTTLRSLATGSTVPNDQIKFIKNYRRNTEQLLMTPDTLLKIIDENLGLNVKSEIQKIDLEAKNKRLEYNKGKGLRMNSGRKTKNLLT
jgi:transposase